MAGQPPAGAALGALGAPPPPPLTTYAQYLQDADHDPHGGNYAAMLTAFAVEPHNNAPSTPENLRTAVYNMASRNQFNSLVVHVVGTPGDPADMGHVQLYHNVTTYPAAFGTQSNWDGRAFATFGDVMHGQFNTVEWPHALMNQTTVLMRLPSREDAVQAFTADANLDHLGPYGANAPNTVEARTRTCQYVPFRYAAYFLVPRTPRECVTELVPLIDQNGDLPDCGPLVTYLLATATHQTVANAQAGPSTGRAAPTPVIMDADLVAHRRTFIERDLPNLSQARVTAGAQAIVTGIAGLTDAITHGQQVEAARRAPNQKTVESMLGGAQLARLCRLCNVGAEAQLPPIWRQLANTSVRERRQVLQRAFANVGHDIDRRQQFVWPTHLIDMVTEMRIPSSDETDFTNGLNPFQFGYITPEGLRQEERRAQQYDIIHQGASTTLQDTVIFLVNDDRDITLPVSHDTSVAMLIQLRAAVAMLLGEAHPWNAELAEFVDEYRGRLVTLRTIPLQPHQYDQYPLVPCMLVRWLQVRLTSWLRNQADSPAFLPVPNLNNLWMEVYSGGPWMLALPARYLQRLDRIAQGFRGGDDNHNHRSEPPPTPASLPPVSAPSSSPAPASRPRQEYVGNTAWDRAHFNRFREMQLRSRDVRERATRPPPLCPSWHVRAGCNVNCSMADTHRVPTTEETNAMLEWLQEFWVPPPTSS